MARQIITETISLDYLIPQYGVKNTECNALKKEVTSLNAQIKSAILEQKKENTDIQVDGWKCSLTVTQDEDPDEDKVLEVAKKYNITDVIKTKEYIDFDALEKLIYSGEIDKEVLSEINTKCKTVKTRETLRCTKVKEA